MSPAHSTCTPSDRTEVCGRQQVAALLDQLEETSASQRQFAREHQVPRSTLQYWLQRRRRLDAHPQVVAFFESEIGLLFLHRLLLAAHLIFSQQGGCGLRLISWFLRLTQLDRFAAASFGSQQQLAQTLEEAIVRFGRQQREQLAPTMPRRTIALCEDETFHRLLCLVALEPVSGFLLLERYAADREAKTWDQHVQEALQGLPVQVAQSVSDEAKGIQAHAKQGLGAAHAPDLFHVQHDICKGTFPTLAKQTRQAQKRLDKAGQQLDKLKRQQAQEQPRSPDEVSPREQVQAQKQSRAADEISPPELVQSQEQPRPADEVSPLEQVQAQEQPRPADQISPLQQAQGHYEQCQQEVAACQQRQQAMRQAVRGLSEAYHPFDLHSGQARTAAQVEQALTEHFRQLEQTAQQASLPERCQQRLAKAKRVMPGLVATLALFWLRVQTAVAACPAGVQAMLRGPLLAGHYLLLAARKASTAVERARLRALGQQCLQQAVRPAEVSEPDWAQAQRLAQQMAGWFVRSSACVEGRNGQLRWRYQSGRGLSERKLAVLTTLHNYWIQRPDGSTAAERFFGSKPDDLFEWLIRDLPLPARPARRRTKVA